MLNVKTGRRAAIHTRRTMRSALIMAKALDALGAGPQTTNDYRVAVNKATGGDWGMMGNDTAGDCVWADSGHHLMLRTANAAGQIVIPTAQEVLACYSAVTGYMPGNTATDVGTNEVDAMAYLKSVGLLGHKSDDYGTIDPLNQDHVRWCVQLFGECRLGILVTPGMIQQFEDKQPWTRLLNDATPDGHDVPIVYCDPNWAYVITWAGEQRVAWSLLANPNFVDEAHAELYFDWIREQGTAPSNLDLNQLDADLRYISDVSSVTSVSTQVDHGALEAVKYGIARSPHWAAVEREFKEMHPNCAAGGRGPIQVHHKSVSFHVAKLLGRDDLELTLSNLISLTEGPDEDNDGLYHLLLGHGDNFQHDCNPHVDEDVVTFHGIHCAQIRTDPTWQAHAAACPPPWNRWTRDMKITRRQALDIEFPIDGAECQAVVTRFPDVAPVPYDVWLSTLSPD
jgi:hypothetical protein